MRTGALIAVLLVAVTACFSPTPASGVPCDPTAAICPAGQSCVAQGGGFFCNGGPSNMPDGGNPDMPTGGEVTPFDHDGDGVLDVDDNCPDTPNPSQANEDADSFGDACDPCPPVADNQQIVDGDGDGVSDACDPNPNKPGDKIALFEGFHDGIPSGWDGTGGVSASNGDVVIEAAGNTSELLGVTEPAGDHLYVATGVTFVAGAANGAPIFAVVDRREPGTDNTISCQLVAGAIPKLRIFSAGAAGGGNLADADHVATDGDSYLFVLERSANDYSCFSNNPDTSVLATDPFAPNNAEVGLRARGATAAYHWLMVITAP